MGAYGHTPPELTPEQQRARAAERVSAQCERDGAMVNENRRNGDPHERPRHSGKHSEYLAAWNRRAKQGGSS
jgi:hypothetical protein